MQLKELFKDKQFYKTLFAISAPIMLQNLVNSFVNMVDTVMIGRLGTVEIAAVGLGNQVFFFFNRVV
jgi:Na+-driven multidrug efflux pump